MATTEDADCFDDQAQLAIAAERAQLRLIGYPHVDRARPLNQRVQRLQSGVRFVRMAFLLLLVLTACSDRQPPHNTLDANSSSQTPLLNYCELTSSSAQYLNKDVRLRTVYRYGFEWAEAYSIRCLDAPTTWVDFTADAEACLQPNVRQDLDAALEQSGDRGKTLGVVFRGRLIGTGGHFGHLGSYSNEFQVSCIESFVILDDAGDHRTKLTPELKDKIASFEAGR